ncbi:MAG TPA: glycosyltransferase [Bryobacteraceae bacterium]|nr:glycosyltransferase [Bryobacteraceae bacterium]
MNNETPYQKVTIDVEQPLPEIRIPRDHFGIGVFLRRAGKPIGFFQNSFAAGTVLTPDHLAALILKRAGADIVRSGMRKVGTPGDETWPAITVAICTKDRACSLEPCLESLMRVRFREDDAEPKFAVMVVDNAPSDGSTRELAGKYRSIDYVVEPKAGLDFARNTAVLESKGDYVAFLDDDVTVDTAWFAGLRRALRENPEAVAITGPVMPMELATRAQVLFEERGGFSHGFGTVRHTEDTPGTFTRPCNAGTFGAGCNMVFSRELVLRIGLFDEALDTGRPLPGGGDLDMLYRVLRTGKPLVYEGSMAVYHRHRRDYQGLRRQMWTWGLGFMAFLTKTYEHDAASRDKVRMTVVGFFLHMVRMALLTGLGRWKHQWGVDLSIWEAVGGVQGLAGEYGRSRRRIEAIRARHA